MAASVSLITPTSNRPEALAICAKYVSRMRENWKGEIQWVVADGSSGENPTPDGCDNHARVAYEGNPATSLCKNILAALDVVEHEVVLFIEDDDWYHEEYIGFMLFGSGGAEIFGVRDSLYYNLQINALRKMPTVRHSSLCSTGIRGDAAKKHLRRTCEDMLLRGQAFVDVDLWKRFSGAKKLFPQEQHVKCVGIKGLPGRAGIGVGHRPRGPQWVADPERKKLRELIGEDAAFYAPKERRVPERENIILEIGGWNTPAPESTIQADAVPRDGVALVFEWGKDEIPLKDNSLGGIIAVHVLEHVPWWRVGFALSEALRVLKPGGFLEVHVPDIAKAVNLIGSGRMPVNDAFCADEFEQFNSVVCWGDPHAGEEAGGFAHFHKTAWTPYLLTDRLSRAGFVEINKAANRPPHFGEHAWHNLGVKAFKP